MLPFPSPFSISPPGFWLLGSRSPTPTTSIVFKLAVLSFLLISLCAVPVLMTVKGGTSQACAACKYQRRKCSDNCPLAPYFPANNPRMFENAHRLFGVSNMMKVLKKVNEDQKHDAMQSIIYESNMRKRFPIHGCCGIIRQLHQQLQEAMNELYLVNARLHMLREQQFNTNNLPLPPSPSQPLPSQPSDYSPSSHLQQMMIESNSIPVYPYLFDHHHHHPYQFDQHHHHHPPVLVTPGAHSNQLLINENKGSHHPHRPPPAGPSNQLSINENKGSRHHPVPLGTPAAPSNQLLINENKGKLLINENKGSRHHPVPLGTPAAPSNQLLINENKGRRMPAAPSNQLLINENKGSSRHHPPPPVPGTPAAPSNQLLINENKGSRVDKKGKSIWVQSDFDNINGNSSMEFLLQYFNSQAPIVDDKKSYIFGRIIEGYKMIYSQE